MSTRLINYLVELGILRDSFSSPNMVNTLAEHEQIHFESHQQSIPKGTSGISGPFDIQKTTRRLRGGRDTFSNAEPQFQKLILHFKHTSYHKLMVLGCEL